MYNAKSVQRDNPYDNRSIVSINTDTSSFMFRVQGHDDGSQLTKVVNGKEVKVSAKQERYTRSRRDLSVH